MDFSDLGGVRIADANVPAGRFDFSDLGGRRVDVAASGDAVQDEGALSAAGRGALRNVPLGQQAVAAAAPLLGPAGLTDEPTYGAELEHLTRAAEAAKAAHPVAYGAGAVAGAAAPLLVPGAGEALAASYPAAMAGNAALGAAQAVSDTPLTTSPGLAARQAARGAGMGAALGAAGKWLGDLLPTPSEQTAGAAAQWANVPARRLSNIVGSDATEGLNDVADTLNATTLPDGKPLVELSDSALRKASKVADAIEMYGKQIGGVTNAIDRPIPAKALINDIKRLGIADSGLSIDNDHLEQIAKIIAKNAENGKLSFPKLRDLTNHVYRNMVEEDPVTGRLLPGSEKALDAWRYLRSLQDAVIKDERPDLYPQFSAATRHYSNLIGLRKAMNAAGLRDEVKQINLGANVNPLTLASNVGKGIGKVTGLNRAVNNAAMRFNPLLRGSRTAAQTIPQGLAPAESTDLADYLAERYEGR